MIVNNGYAIEQCKSKIVIELPQTAEMMQNTVSPLSKRKNTLTDNELSELLLMAMTMFERQ